MVKGWAPVVQPVLDWVSGQLRGLALLAIWLGCVGVLGPLLLFSMWTVCDFNKYPAVIKSSVLALQQQAL
jgi:hypothetical protein